VHGGGQVSRCLVEVEVVKQRALLAARARVVEIDEGGHTASSSLMASDIALLLLRTERIAKSV
jgi:hypothetical protein